MYYLIQILYQIYNIIIYVEFYVFGLITLQQYNHQYHELKDYDSNIMEELFHFKLNILQQ